MTPFESAFARTIGEEGGLSLSTKDPGNYTPAGELLGTLFGISARSYEADLRRMLATDRASALAIAQGIYQRDFWSAMGCDLLPSTVAAVVFDVGANSGPGVGVRLLQMALAYLGHPLAIDGALGEATRAAVAAERPDDLLRAVVAYRLVRYVRLVEGDRAHYQEDARGWLRRACAYLERPA